MKKKNIHIDITKKGFENWLKMFSEVQKEDNWTVGDTIRVNEHMDNSDSIIFEIKDDNDKTLKPEIAISDRVRNYPIKISDYKNQ